MTGVEILNVTTSFPPFTVFVVGIICLGVLFCVGMMISDFFKQKKIWRGIGMIALALMLIIVYVEAGTNIIAATTKPRYEVLIDDSVSMDEFYQKYEIVEKKGKIWVVEERD